MLLQAVRLLKRGGVLVYSTCTVTLAENEEQVAWALNTFPCLALQPQVEVFKPRAETQKCIQRCKELAKSHSRSCVSFSGASHWCRRHAGSRAVTWAAASPPEIQTWAELGRDRNDDSPPLQSQQGHYRLFYCQVPEKLTVGHVFSYSSHTRPQTGTIVFILRHSVCFDGPVLTKMLTVLFTASAS